MNTYKMVLNEDTRVLIYGNSIKVVRIRIDEINYISCANRIIMIHTNNASDRFYGKMKDVYNLLGKYGARTATKMPSKKFIFSSAKGKLYRNLTVFLSLKQKSPVE